MKNKFLSKLGKIGSHQVFQGFKTTKNINRKYNRLNRPYENHSNLQQIIRLQELERSKMKEISNIYESFVDLLQLSLVNRGNKINKNFLFKVVNTFQYSDSVQQSQFLNGFFITAFFIISSIIENMKKYSALDFFKNQDALSTLENDSKEKENGDSNILPNKPDLFTFKNQENQKNFESIENTKNTQSEITANPNSPVDSQAITQSTQTFILAQSFLCFFKAQNAQYIPNKADIKVRQWSSENEKVSENGETVNQNSEKVSRAVDTDSDKGSLLSHSM